MKAAQIREVGKMELIDVEMPKLIKDHVLLKVNAISICGTDIHEFEGRIPVQLPRIPGHDFAGTVMELGADVVKSKVGDRVVVKPSFPCYQCDACKRGFLEGCQNAKLIGIHSDGCFREYMVVPEANLIPLNQEISFDAACVLEPFTVGLNAFLKLKMNLGQTVAILGQGPIGLGLTRIAALSGASNIYAIDIREDVLEVARKYGATDVINMTTEKGKELLNSLSEKGADIVIEAAGASATVEMIPKLVKKEGKVVCIGAFWGIGSIPIWPIVMKALNIIGVGGNGGKGKYETALNFVKRGLIDPTQMVSHKLPFLEAVEAFEIARAKASGTIKVVVSA